MSEQAKKRDFLVDMHYFRAFAILNVVFIHIWRLPMGVSYKEFPSWLGWTNVVLFHDSTIYFVFISGFLFHYLSGRFNITKYFKGRLLNVISPYLIISTLIYALNPLGLGVFEYSVRGYITCMLNGTAQVQLWYIPFISLIFAVSPLLLKIEEKYFIPAALALMLLPILGTRTETYITIGQYLYFFPVYCFGMVCSMRYERFVQISVKYFTVFCALAVLSSVLVALECIQGADSVPVLNMEGLFFLQKLFLLFVVVRLLQGLKNRQFRVLNVLADFSFAIYFFHVLVFDLMGALLLAVLPTEGMNWGLIGTLLTLTAATVTVLLTVGLKRLLGRSSRMLIGA